MLSYKALTTDSYHGTAGNIGLYTFLNGDGSPSDLLVINGGVATGNTKLLVSNSGGMGQLTQQDDIMIVQTQNGATTNPDTFTLEQRVAAGAYEYNLYRGGNTSTGGDPNDQNWYLRNATD